MDEDVNTNYYWPAFVDFMIVLFFIALAIAAHKVQQYDKKEKELNIEKALVDSTKKNLAGLHDLQRVLNELMQIQESLYTQLSNSHIRIDTSNKEKIKLLGDFYFEHDSFNLKQEAIGDIITIGNSIRDILIKDQNFEKYMLIIEGHTDSVGTEEYNTELSFKRATSITKLWAQHCELQLPRYLVLPTGFGELNPLPSKDSGNARAANRRIEIDIIPKLSEFTKLIQQKLNALPQQP